MDDKLLTGEESTGSVKLVYILYLVSLLLAFTSIIAVIIAYIYRSDAADWLQQHYRFQIRTFWIGFIFLILSGALMFVGVGFFIYLLWLIWMIVRCVKGLKALGRREPPANPGTWLF